MSQYISKANIQGIQRRMVLVVNVFDFLNFVCFVATIFDLVHEVEAIHGQC